MGTTAAVANTSNTGTVNVYIQGQGLLSGANSVKSVTITLSGTAGDFWLSDIWACVYTDFPTNYFNVSKPYTNQPAYTIGAGHMNQTASAIALTPGTGPTIGGATLTTGVARYIFKDASSSNIAVNVLGYDPYNHILYYALDGTTNPNTDKAIKKYSFNNLGAANCNMTSGVISTIIADVTASPFNIPVLIMAQNPEVLVFTTDHYMWVLKVEIITATPAAIL